MLLRNHIFIAALALLICAPMVDAQSTAVTYQGKLTDSGNPATGSYDLQVKLFDTATVGTGTQQGSTVTASNVLVTSGIFTVSLDFGVCASCFNGAARFLEIAVKPTSGGTFTTLEPRQPLTSTPYAIRSLNSTAADGLSVACVSCITSSQIQSIDGVQITGVVAGSQISGEIPTASVPTGSGNYIQNAVAALRAGKPGAPAQEGSFDLSGDGTLGGTLSANVVDSATQFNLAGNRILSIPGSNNLFVGLQTGAANTTGADNAFFGPFAGQNSTGSANSFFGVVAGFNNTGNDNSFFGRSAGFTNTSGHSNSFFGVQAGRDNSTGSFNSFFGYQAGILNVTGQVNAFFGYQAGRTNTTGSWNAFFGNQAGYSNTWGNNNAFFGHQAGLLNTTGSANAFFGTGAGFTNTTGISNAFFGPYAGESNTTGNANAFFGREAGQANISGTNNSFFGHLAGSNTNLGNNNAFFGWGAGSSNFTGSSNTLMGVFADVGSGNLDHASAIGAGAIVTADNTVQIGRLGLDKVAIGAFASSTLKPVCINSEGVLAGCAQISNPICINSAGDFVACGSSLRYKSNVHPFPHGMALLRKLRPVAYTCKDDGKPDVGLIAEEVAAVEPLLTIYNHKGEIEGVKYPQLNVVLINALKEQQAEIEKQTDTLKRQQTQIENQQTQIRERVRQAASQQTQLEQYRNQLAQQQGEIDALKQLLCPTHPQAEVCQVTRPKK